MNRLIPAVTLLALIVPSTVFAQAQTKRGAAVGGLAGAVVGGLIGDKNNEAGAGAAIGGVLGAVTGGVLGNAADQSRRSGSDSTTTINSSNCNSSRWPLLRPRSHWLTSSR